MSDVPEALIEKAAKAIHADACCPADGVHGACDYPSDLWADVKAARIALEAVADDIRAEALRDAAERLEARSFAVAGQHHIYYSVPDSILACLCGFRSHVKRDMTEHILNELDAARIARGTTKGDD